MLDRHMTGLTEQPTPERLQQVAQQTYEAIRQRGNFLARWLTGHNELDRAIAECVTLSSEVDPSAFSEAAFEEVLSALTRVIDALELYFTKHGNENDVAQCYFLGHALNSLKGSRHWIAQGLSPNPQKRPTDDERRSVAEQHATDRLQGLFA